MDICTQATKPRLALALFGLTLGLANPCDAQDEAQPVITTIKSPAWVALGGQFKRGLSVLDDNGNITVYGVGSDNALWTVLSTDKGVHWNSPVSHGGHLGSGPSCEQDPDVNGVRCFWKLGGSVYGQLLKTEGDEKPIPIQGKFPTTQPSVVSGYVFVRADDNQLWVVRTQGGQLLWDWESRGGVLAGSPSCVTVSSYHDARDKPNTSRPLFSCFVIGSDGWVWMERHDDVYSKQTDVYHNVWTKLSGMGLDGISAWHKEGGLTGVILAVRGLDSMLWTGREVITQGASLQDSKSEWQWQNYPGEISSVPACTSSYCFAILPDGQLGFLDLSGRL